MLFEITKISYWLEKASRILIGLKRLFLNLIGCIEKLLKKTAKKDHQRFNNSGTIFERELNICEHKNYTLTMFEIVIAG